VIFRLIGMLERVLPVYTPSEWRGVEGQGAELFFRSDEQGDIVRVAHRRRVTGTHKQQGVRSSSIVASTLERICREQAPD